MPNNINSSIFNYSCSQYQSQRSTSANFQCQQQDNSTQLTFAKNEQIIRDTKPYISSSGDTSSSALNITNRPIKEKTLPCGYPSCNKTFPSKSKLTIHQRIHTGERPYKCNDCDQGFTVQWNLDQHKITHTKEKSFKCTSCNACFTQIGSLNRHKRTHKDERSFKCTICHEAFNQKSHLTQHQRRHTNEKPFKCTSCDKSFTRNQNLVTHKKTHIQNNQIDNPIDNQIREFIENCNDDKKKILNSSYNSIVQQCQDKSISIEETLVNIFSILTRKYISNDDVQNVAVNLVSIITQLPPQFKSTLCLGIRDNEKIKTYTEIVFILKNHTADEFIEKYLKIDIPQSDDTQHLPTKKRTGSNSLNDDETIPSKKIKQAHEIKIEPGSELTLDIDGLQITSTSKIIQAHNNSLPILHAPGDNTKDLMPESENTTLKISMWGDNLKAIFATMPQDEQKQAKQSIIQQCNDWVSLNRDKREEYAKNLDDSLEITIPIIDEVERGTSVFAKKPFKIFDVIGPFSGALYTNQKDLNNRMRKQGTSNVMEFLFNTISKNRFIDGTQGGNTLSYINTGQLLDYPKIAENNLAIIYAGKNFSFYVAIKPIAQGEELFIDYGPNYTGREQIKVEAE